MTKKGKETALTLVRYLEKHRHLTVLLYGKSGSGKTYFANEFCSKLKINIRNFIGPEIGSNFKNKIVPWKGIIIDEIHSVKARPAELLYEILNTPFEGLILFGTTTNPWLLPDPFRNRFNFQLNMEKINEELLSSPLNLRQQRNLSKILEVVKDLDKALEYLDLDEYGLDSIQKRYLEIVKERQPVSLTVVSGILKLKDKEVRKLEADLIDKGLIEITTRGRIIRNERIPV